MCVVVALGFVSSSNTCVLHLMPLVVGLFNSTNRVEVRFLQANV